MKKSVLFVCMANICRSPALAATLRHLAVQKSVADLFHVDSCGIGWFHLGESPDPRMFQAAKERGILIDHRAKQFEENFFDFFDVIFVVDSVVAEQVKLQAKEPKHKKKIFLATEYSRNFKGQPIPDPYYMNVNGCEELMEMVIDCCEGILEQFAPQ